MSRKYLIEVTETYVNTFYVIASDEENAKEVAEEMSVERNFPPGHSESCERTIKVTAP